MTVNPAVQRESEVARMLPAFYVPSSTWCIIRTVFVRYVAPYEVLRYGRPELKLSRYCKTSDVNGNEESRLHKSRLQIAEEAMTKAWELRAGLGINTFNHHNAVHAPCIPATGKAGLGSSCIHFAGQAGLLPLLLLHLEHCACDLVRHHKFAHRRTLFVVSSIPH